MLRTLLALLLCAALAAGCTDKLSFSSASPEDAFTLTPESGDATTVFRVDAGNLPDAYNITWDFGDGHLAYGRTAEHRYGFTNGVMTIQRIATRDGEEPVVVSRTVTLGTGINAPPVLVSIRASPTWVEVGQETILNAYATDTDRDPLAYQWTSVKEGATGAAVVLPAAKTRTTVAFDEPGRYLLEATVRDPKGGEARDVVVVDVSRKIPDPQLTHNFTGTLLAGTGSHGVSEATWGVDEAPDTNADAARHPFRLDFPASLYVTLRWTSASDANVTDLDFEVRDADGNAVLSGKRHPVDPANPGVPVPSPWEINATQVPEGDYVLVVQAYTGAQIAYEATAFVHYQLTPELVAAKEGA